MLDRMKMLTALQGVSERLFVDCSDQYAYLKSGWQVISKNKEMPPWIEQIQTPWALPRWEGAWQDRFQIEPLDGGYVVIGTDGSQIYPDRHQGTTCFLIQTATIALSYAIEQVPRVQMTNEPHVFVGHDDYDAYAAANDFVDCVREELELMHGTRAAGAWMADAHTKGRVLALFDGALIFWHLQHKEPQMRNRYVARYVQQLMALYKARIPCAWYISMPRSKELVHLAHAALWQEALVTPGTIVLKQVFDDDVIEMILEPGQRTICFEPNYALCELYPEPVRPRALYLHVGAEIVRLELPAWVCADNQLLSWVCSVVYDQVIKGNGYPVALAEAHAHAVIQNNDREFFYHALQKMSMDRAQSMSGSLKRAKKKMLYF